MPVPRPVLVVAPLASSRELLEELGKLRWSPTHVDDLQTAASILRARHYKVALLVLERGYAEAPRHFKACVAAGGDCEWVGVFPPGEGTQPPRRELILTHFFDHHTFPPNRPS